MGATATNHDKADAVAEVYERWRQAWLAQPVGTGMKELWDQGYPDLAYLSEEIPDAMFSWSEIDAYWDFAPTLVKAIPEFDTLTRKIAFVGNVSLVYAKLHMSMDIAGVPDLFIGDLRVSIGMHEVDGQWKLIHYHESRMLDIQKELGITLG